MKSKTTIITIAVALLVVGTGAFYFLTKEDNKATVTNSTTNTQGEEQTQTDTAEITKATDIQSTVAAWKAAGLTVSDDKGAYYQMIGATSGGKYDVGEINVELYEFSDNAKANDAKTSIFADDSGTALVVGTLLVWIESTDVTQVDQIKAVF